MTIPNEAYNPNIPQFPVFPGNAQDEVLSNFYWLNEYYRRDHVALTDTSASDGMHTKLFIPKPVVEAPNLPDPRTSVYTQLISDKVQLLFQNDNLPAFIEQLTGMGATAGTNGFYIETPWGLIFNFGSVKGRTATEEFDLPKAFTTAAYSIVATITGNARRTQPGASFVGLNKFRCFSTPIDGRACYYLAVGV